VFLAIFQVIQCFCHIFHVFHFSRQNSGSIVFVSHFTRFSVFLAKFHVLSCEFLIFLIVSFLGIFQVHFSFSTFLSVSRYIPGQIVFVSHFPPFSVFCHIPGPRMCFSHF
jgi:hypothetical protein